METTVEEYKGINYDRKFPSKTYFGIDGYPRALTDGFVLDLFVDRRKRNMSLKVWKKEPYESLIESIRSNSTKLREPIFSGTLENGVRFLVFENKEYFVIQEKYYIYFKSRYPNCELLASEKIFSEPSTRFNPIRVRSGRKTVGIIMPFAMDAKPLIAKMREPNALEDVVSELTKKINERRQYPSSISKDYIDGVTDGLKEARQMVRMKISIPAEES